MITKKDLNVIMDALTALYIATYEVYKCSEFKDDVKGLLFDLTNAKARIDLLMVNPEPLPVGRSIAVKSNALNVIDEGKQLMAKLMLIAEKNLRVEESVNNKKMLERCLEDDCNG